ncbi:Cation/H(+) antiporter 28 [Platanthera guangdongensis]|uniref:Cation/H(+) antiporter 28 n=1 Tax=Platanthera guangdongensis TaxID=2320717 RepID=A0ABR2LCV9_9ASPA
MSQNNNNNTTTPAVHDKLNAAEAKTHCSLISSSIAASLGIFFLNIAVILFSCRLVHAVLRRLGQHRLVSDFSIGLLIGNSSLLRSTIEEYVIASFANIGTLSFCLYLFVLGLEMDPKSIRRWSGPANKIAYAGIISTVAVAVVSYTLVNHTAPQLGMNHNYGIICAIAVGLSSTSSPIVTRLITELKMNKSEIGRLAVRAGIANDMLCTFLLCAGVALHPLFSADKRAGSRGLLNAFIIAIEAVFITKIINPFLILKLNYRNPDRKPIRSLDMAVLCFVSAFLCFSSMLYGFRPSFNSFFVGLCLPRDGRLSNILISRCNFILTTIMLPIYIVFVCLSSNYKPFIWPHIESGTVFILLIVGSIGAVGKLMGTVAYSIHHGVQWREAVALGLLLNIKGHFHIFCAHKAAMAGIIDANTMTVMGLVAVGTVIPMPLVVGFLRRRMAAREMRSPMGLQWCETGREVKIVVGLHGPEDVPMAVNVMEAMRVHGGGVGGGGGGGGLVAIVVEMVQMTDRAAASLVHGEGLETVTVTDEGIVEKREQIGFALEAYGQESGDGVTVRRILAVSAFDHMHQDICSAARECMAALVVLPFHCRQRVDGEMEAGHPGHRIINQKVLEGSPCSVGILVNRSLGRGPVSSLSVAGSHNICAVFIGGGDDREALAYATRMARHPGVRLTVLRFVQAAAAKTKPWGPGRRILATTGRRELEQRADEEFFAWFYDRYVAGEKGVGYMEKQVSSGEDTMAALKGVEAHYQLFVLGSGKDRLSSLTAGMNEWAEFPELGPIGDVMASSDFSVSASVMVIQQHRVARRYNVIDEEFLPY